MSDLPVLPYRGTEGFVKRDASLIRAVDDARSGKAHERQRLILSIIRESGSFGRTWKEVNEVLPTLHHGQISATLSVLHKAGLLFQRTTKRDKSHPYVASEFRGLFSPEERYDNPTRTTAGDLRKILMAARAEIEASREIIFEMKRTADSETLVGLSIADDLLQHIADTLSAEGNDDRLD